MNKIVDETICPFCHANNECMAHSDEPCWCTKITIPQELLDLVPDTQKGTSCICLSCIEAFIDNPSRFKKSIS